jgi:ABC-type phosphate transport system permease subunit
MIGYVQGIQSVVDEANSMLTALLAATVANFSSLIASSIGANIEQAANPDYGSLWEFGIVLAIFGFIFIALGDFKAAQPQSQEVISPAQVPPADEHREPL